MSRSAIPEPGPLPTQLLKVVARLVVPEVIEGSSHLSAITPAMMGAMGWVNQAISRRAEKTRPWISGATLACQMDWLEVLINGPTRAWAMTNGIQKASPVPNPKKAVKIPAMNHPASTPWVRFLNPPQALMISPPATPPIAIAELTEPKMTRIVVGAQQDHRGKDRKANSGKQVAEEEDHLQPEQAGAFENIFKPICGLLPDAAFFLLAFHRFFRLRHMDECQGAKGDEEGDHIDGQDDGQAVELGDCQHRACQDGSQHPGSCFQ